MSDGVSSDLESAADATETRPRVTFGGDWFINSRGERVGIEKDRDRSKWWVVIDGRRLSDHVNRSAAATAANNHR